MVLLVVFQLTHDNVILRGSLAISSSIYFNAKVASKPGRFSNCAAWVVYNVHVIMSLTFCVNWNLRLPVRFILCSSPPFFISSLSLGTFVTESFDLAVASVNQVIVLRALLVCVNLNVQGNPLDPLLVAEVCAETVDRDVHPDRSLHGTPLDCHSVESNLFNILRQNTLAVFRIYGEKNMMTILIIEV